MNLTTEPFPSSRKIYIQGEGPGVRVPMREIRLSSTRGVENPPVKVYDTSGPYTDPAVSIDLQRGLPPLRREWIRARPGANVTQLH